jgi:hypothetical protein
MKEREKENICCKIVYKYKCKDENMLGCLVGFGKVQEKIRKEKKKKKTRRIKWIN